MGFEVFRVKLRGVSATFAEVDKTVRWLPHVQPDENAIPLEGTEHFILDDGQHVIELELRAAPVCLSCQFTLSHPPSVDAVFLELMRDLINRLGLEAEICDDALSEDVRSYSINNFAAFATAVSRGIAVRRLEWIATFGAETLAAGTNELYQRIILPRCHPVSEPSNRG